MGFASVVGHNFSDGHFQKRFWLVVFGTTAFLQIVVGEAFHGRRCIVFRGGQAE